MDSTKQAFIDERIFVRGTKRTLPKRDRGPWVT